MTGAPVPARRGARVWLSPLVVWCAFVGAHVWLGTLNLYGPGFPLGDVTSVYKFWVDQAVTADFWVGIDSSWVYPIVAIVPMLMARAAYPIASGIPALAPSTLDAGLYASSWLALVFVLDLVAFGVLTGWGRRRDRVSIAWWWVVFLIALGPIALGRIDAITVPLAIVAVLVVATRPALASLILTIAAWIKVWPGAIVIALLIASKNRGVVFLTAAGASIAVVALTLSFGSGANVVSFVVQQADRGLQIEAPVTTFWMWLAASGDGSTTIYYDTTLLTWQVRGQGVALASSLMTPLLILAVTAIAITAVLVVARGARASAVLPPLVLALLAAMIVFQKVGSPQFISWLAVPVIFGLATQRTGGGPPFRAAAALVVVIAGLTQVMYPVLYGYVVGAWPLMLLVLTARNLLLVALLAWAVAILVRSGSGRDRESVAESSIAESDDDRGLVASRAP